MLPTLEQFATYANITKPGKEPLLQAALDASIDHVRRLPRQIDLLPPSDSDPVVTVSQRVTNACRLIRVPDARVVTEVLLDGAAITDYELRTSRAPTAVWVEIFDDTVDLSGVKLAEVTGRFGMSPIPDELHLAILTLALRRYREREIGDGTSGASDEYGGRPLPPFPKHIFEAYAVGLVAA